MFRVRLFYSLVARIKVYFDSFWQNFCEILVSKNLKIMDAPWFCCACTQDLFFVVANDLILYGMALFLARVEVFLVYFWAPNWPLSRIDKNLLFALA